MNPDTTPTQPLITVDKTVDEETDGIHLLIVDDDEDDFFLVEDLLDEITDHHYLLQRAATFEQGRALLADNRHDLCLMDYKLGARDGIELLKEAQQLGFSGPIILLTGMADAAVDMRALGAGAVDYLAKADLSAEQLARSIRYALARREVEQARVERLRAEAENRSKSEFLTHLSHELRTPLSAILGFTELMINEAEQENLNHLRIIQRNGKHLLALLNDILDLSKIEAGKLELEQQRVELSALLADIQFMMHGAATDKQLHWHIHIPEPLPVNITTDPTRLRQVLVNLIGNAIKFTDQGEVQLEVLPESSNQEGYSLLRFNIKDSGVGISSEAQQQIFQPFVQSPDNSHNRPGTGLGLAISKQLVESLGGNIDVSSTVGHGSTFSFTLDPGPCSAQDFVPLTLQAQSSEHAGKVDIPRLSGTVLVVDDLADIRTLVGHFVQQTGIQVQYAENGEQALQRVAASGPFDVILMDIQMPVLNGHQAATELRTQGDSTPLIALTAAHMQGDSERCLQSGFNDYLAKPVDQQQLYQRLQHYISEPAMPEHPMLEPGTPEPATISKRPDDLTVGAQPLSGSAATAADAPTILVIDDERDALEALCTLLNLAGYRTRSALSATAAVAALTTDHTTINMIITDLNLPDCHGYELIQQLNTDYPDIPVIIISGEEISKLALQQYAIYAALLKPVSLAELEPLLIKLQS